MRALLFVLAVVAHLPANAGATQKVVPHITTYPEVGTPVIVAAGDPVWSSEYYEVSEVVKESVYLSSKVVFGNFMRGTITVPQDAVFETETQGVALIACTKLNMAFGRNRPCLIDEDKDGVFERMYFKGSDKPSEKLENPAPYRKIIDRDFNEIGKRFKSLILYLGSNGTSVSFSYREFSDNIARPAFTQELILPLGKNFPQDMRIKGASIRILALDGTGMKYVLTESRTSAQF
ncbi:hypothetical protein PX699_00365 [Sphingobium sp. H39-3-25]|uniref:hypothetical protein n=1 Tax=Sphingobium arseniciresistens TaxID=3030834 RepID=UPI0023B9968E|nr:hypothetical protein [Sphingobium arseniciresistens]